MALQFSVGLTNHSMGKLSIGYTKPVLRSIIDGIESFQEGHAVDEVESIPRRGTNVIDHEIDEVI